MSGKIVLCLLVLCLTLSWTECRGGGGGRGSGRSGRRGGGRSIYRGRSSRSSSPNIVKRGFFEWVASLLWGTGMKKRNSSPKTAAESRQRAQARLARGPNSYKNSGATTEKNLKNDPSLLRSKAFDSVKPDGLETEVAKEDIGNKLHTYKYVALLQSAVHQRSNSSDGLITGN